MKGLLKDFQDFTIQHFPGNCKCKKFKKYEMTAIIDCQNKMKGDIAPAVPLRTASLLCFSVATLEMPLRASSVAITLGRVCMADARSD